MEWQTSRGVWHTLEARNNGDKSVDFAQRSNIIILKSVIDQKKNGGDIRISYKRPFPEDYLFQVKFRF